MLEGSYPRPQLVRDDWVSLDGVWDFGYDDEDRGLAERWYASGNAQATVFDREIRVPFPPESRASGVHDPSFHPVVWYRRVLTAADLPAEVEGGRLHLHFGAVDYRATVWLDGVQVAEHVGGQTPFTADVSAILDLDGEHVIVVRAYDDPASTDQPRGKQDWELNPHGIWYHRTTGIWQTVWLEAVPGTHVVSLRWTPDAKGRRVSCEVRLSDSTPCSVEIALWNGERSLSRSALLHQGRAALEIDVSHLAPEGDADALLWSPESPSLVDATVTVKRAEASVSEADFSEPIDQVSSYFGLCSVAVSRRQFLLNGKPQYLRAVLDQGYWKDSHLANPGADWLRHEVETILALGFNTVRVHQKAEDPRFLYWADRLGLMVWAETANARAYSEEAARLLTNEWADLVRRDRSHPSIVTWVPLNESWGFDEVAVSPEQQAVAAELAQLTRALDPTRPVISNDGWEHVDSDILGIHDYASRTSRIRLRYGGPRRLRRTLRSEGPAKRRLLVTDGQLDRYDRGEVPVMMTEFGGVSYAGDGATWGYSTVASDAEYEAMLRGLFDAVRACPDFVGFCYTQLLDTLQEANGLLDADRRPKLSMEKLREIILGGPG